MITCAKCEKSFEVCDYWEHNCVNSENPSLDLVNHPPHYTGHPSGVECIEITEHMNFCLGNALKYIWRSGSKGRSVEDLKKAIWYLSREITRIEEDSKGKEVV